jgi:quercetin dioxygenase-like cupin family protein
MRLTREEIDQQLSTRTVHRNPMEHDAVVILRTSEETNGAYTLLHVEADPGAQVARHYHRTSTETFTALDGVLSVYNAGATTTLQSEETSVVPPGTVHQWLNRSTGRIRFLVEFTPGNTGFEQSLTIIYGLARDGKTLSNGVPRNVVQMALLMEIGDIWLPRISRPLSPVIRALAARARAQGIDRQLVERYCR